MQIFTVIRVAEVLTKFKYATITRIKTHSYQSSQNVGGPLKKVAKVVITLTKSEDFEQLYTEFEKNKPEFKDRRDRRYQPSSKTTTAEKKTAASGEEKSSEDSQEKKVDETHEATEAKEVNLQNSDNEKKEGEDEAKDETINADADQVEDPNKEN